MKTIKKIMILTVLLLSPMAVAVPATNAWGRRSWAKPEVVIHVLGRFTSMWTSTEGDRCFISMYASKRESGWTGRGVFRDKDYKLTAIITVDSTTLENLPDQVNLHGNAKVYINREFVGTYEFDSVIYPPISYVTFQVKTLDYLAYAYEAGDVRLRMGINVL